MNEFSEFISFLEVLGYKNNLTFNQGVDLFVAVKATISNRIGAPKVTNKPTGVGVSGAMGGEVRRSCDLPVNNPANFDLIIVETPSHLVQ